VPETVLAEGYRIYEGLQIPLVLFSNARTSKKGLISGKKVIRDHDLAA
jgi:hypothetical protein